MTKSTFSKVSSWRWIGIIVLGCTAPACRSADVTYGKELPEKVSACSDEGEQLEHSHGLAKEALRAYWSFDEDAQQVDGLQEEWPASTGQGYSLLATPSVSGSDDAETSVPGGFAGSEGLAFDGNNFATLIDREGTDLFGSDFTISAWILVSADGLDDASLGGAGWDLFSSIGDSPGGFKLALERDPNTPDTTDTKLVFRIENQEGNSEQIELPFRQLWGVTWYHIIVSYEELRDGAKISLRHLEVSGEQVGRSEQEGTVRLDSPHQDVRFGRGTDSDPEKPGFSGAFDEIRVFGKALSLAEASAFIRREYSREGPSDCRWRPSGWGTSWAKWDKSSTEQEPTVLVHNEERSQGALTVLLATDIGEDMKGRDLTPFAKAHLSATVDEGKPFAVTINTTMETEAYCSWYFVGTGESVDYSIDLRNPAACGSALGVCEIKLESVRDLWISSDWAKADEVRIAATGLIFERGSDPDGAAETVKGYKNGPSGFCWRSAWYHEGASAVWRGEPSSDQVIVEFGAKEETTVRLFADFGNRPLNLLDCARVELDAVLEFEEGKQPLFSIMDATGVSGDAYLKQDPDDEDKYSVVLGDCDRNTDRDEGVSTEFTGELTVDKSRITEVGVVKAWEDDVGGRVTIKGVRFIGSDGKAGCESRPAAP